MRKLSLRLIILAIVVQPLIDFVAGERVEVFLFGYYWQFADLIAIFAFGLFVLTWLPEEKATRYVRRPRLPTRLLWSFGLVTAFMLLGAARGMLRGYYGTLGDAETLFWILSLAILSYSTRPTPMDMETNISWLQKGALVIAALSIPYGFSMIVNGTPAFGYLHYDAYFLMVFGLLLYLGRSVDKKKINKQTSLGLVVLLVALVVNINKAIVFSLALALLPILWIVSRSPGFQGTYLKVRRSKVTLFIVGISIVLLLLLLVFPDTVGDYYGDFWDERVLHETNLADLNLEMLTGGRTDLWRLSFYWLQDSPWLGQGIGFRVVEDMDLSLQEVQVGFHAHNEYIYLLTALGIPAFSLLCALLYFFMRFMIQKIRHHELPMAARRDFLAYWGFIWFMLAFGLVGLWNISVVGTQLFSLSLGLALTLAQQGGYQAALTEPIWKRISRPSSIPLPAWNNPETTRRAE